MLHVDPAALLDVQQFEQWLDSIDVDDAPPLPLVCGQCQHFQAFRHAPARGYCKAKLVFEPGYSLREVHPERNSNDYACPSVEVNCEF